MLFAHVYHNCNKVARVIKKMGVFGRKEYGWECEVIVVGGGKMNDACRQSTIGAWHILNAIQGLAFSCLLAYWLLLPFLLHFQTFGVSSTPMVLNLK